MTRSNRIANRVIIALVGIVAIAAGLTLALPTFGPRFAVSAPALAAPTASTLWIALAACVVIVVLALVWITTRGRGRTSDLLTLEDDAGSITIDTRVAADLIADALADNRDVVSVGSGGYRMRRQRVLSLRVVARKGADLPRLIASVSDAIDDLDTVFETSVPVLLQVVPAFAARANRTL